MRCLKRRKWWGHSLPVAERAIIPIAGSGTKVRLTWPVMGNGYPLARFRSSVNC